MPSDLTSTQWDGFTVDSSDEVFADEGVLFVPSRAVEDALEAAKSIWNVERRQAETIQAGRKLSEQLDFEGYLTKRNSDQSCISACIYGSEEEL